jgi:hypothetical protein
MKVVGVFVRFRAPLPAGEIDDFAHEMAILSLWLAEHQMAKF